MTGSEPKQPPVPTQPRDAAPAGNIGKVTEPALPGPGQASPASPGERDAGPLSGPPAPDTGGAEPWFDRREARTALGTGLGLLLAGPLVGLLWAALTPRAAVVLTPGGVQLTHPETQAFVTADSTFLLLGAGTGVVSALLAWRLSAQPGPGLAIGLALGGLLAAIVAWKTGHQLHLNGFRRALAVDPPGTRLHVPLDLRAKGVLVGWPLAAELCLLALAGFRPGRRV